MFVRSFETGWIALRVLVDCNNRFASKSEEPFDKSQGVRSRHSRSCWGPRSM